MDAILTLIGLVIWAGQVMAIIVCFRGESPQWLKICGGIGASLFTLAYIGSSL